MITGLLILLIAICSVRYYEQDRQSILIFAALCGFFQFFHHEIYYLVGYQYYLGAAIADLLIIEALYRVKKPTKAICTLQRACIWFIYLNLFGVIIYEAYIDPLVYNILCQSLFVAVLLAFINTGKKDGLGNHSLHSNSGLIFCGNHSYALKIQGNQEAQRP